MPDKTLCPSCGKQITHREGLAWCQDHQMSEKTLQKRIVARAKSRGWKVAHAGRGFVGNIETGEGSWVTPMMNGWPDLFLLKPTGVPPAFAIECKTEVGAVEPEQWDVLKLLIACGIPAAIVRPSDLRSGAVNAMLSAR